MTLDTLWNARRFARGEQKNAGSNEKPAKGINDGESSTPTTGSTQASP
jgi:hypothetical protein